MQIFVDREERPFRGDEENFLPFPAFQVSICRWTINRTDVVGQIVSFSLKIFNTLSSLLLLKYAKTCTHSRVESVRSSEMIER